MNTFQSVEISEEAYNHLRDRSNECDRLQAQNEALLSTVRALIEAMENLRDAALTISTEGHATKDEHSDLLHEVKPANTAIYHATQILERQP
jgi:hypothetical protein